MTVPARECLPLPVYAGSMGVTPDNGDVIDYGVATPAWKQVASILRVRILSGQIEPRHAVPSEKQLEQQLGCARGTVRKAVALLRDEGLVVTVAGRGSYVVSEDELDQYRREQGG